MKDNNQSSKSILVTGASGHIGNVLVRELVNRGEEVLVMTKSGEIPNCLSDLDITSCKGNLKIQSEVENAVSQARIVYHLAGIISISSFDSKELNDTNVRGTKYIVDACIKYAVTRLIYTSSVHALEDLPDGQTIREQDHFDHSNLFGAYARSKAKATQSVVDAVKNSGLDAVICFPTGVMGPYDFRGSEAGKMIKDYASNSLPVYIDGAYNFVDVRDVVHGLLLTAEKARKGEGYILGGEKMSMNDFFEVLEKIEPHMRKPKFRMPVSIAIASAWVLEVICKLIRVKPMFTVYAIKVLQSNCAISSQKAKEELGYSSRPISESIQDTVTWLKENNKL